LKLLKARSHRVARARVPRVSAPKPEHDAAELPLHYPDITAEEAAAQVRRLIINAAPAITESMVRQAVGGNYLHARMLFDLTGFTCAQPVAQLSAVTPLVEILLKEMGLLPPSPPSG